MPITRSLTQTLEIPHEPGYSITIRKLSHYQLGMAEARAQESGLKQFATLGDAASVIAKLQLDAEARERAKAETETPANRYDRATVLRNGITNWTYPEPFSPEATDELDEETAAWAFAEIIAFSVRSADERKASASDSPPTSAQGEGAGLSS